MFLIFLIMYLFQFELMIFESYHFTLQTGETPADPCDPEFWNEQVKKMNELMNKH